jgi:ubiquinone/menaquinone biosynthesis C-methylase UbiE
MATAFMKWLETTPGDYDRGIRMITLGRIRRIKEDIADTYIREGTRVLEIGCGTGTLALMMAERGASVTGIDASPRMLAVAEKKIKEAHLENRVSLKYMDAALVGDRFPPASMDFVVSTLAFSEIPPEEQAVILKACRKLLAPGGRMVIADEVVPENFFKHLLFLLVRLPIVLLTWLITRTTTTALRDFPSMLERTGFSCSVAASYLGESLVLYESSPGGEAHPRRELPAVAAGRLQRRVTLPSLLLEAWMLFFRIIPPYPKVRTGLYAVGNPGENSPVLVTGNYRLTVSRLVRAIDGKIDAWILAADSAGINVWCAAGGGYFTAEKVISAVKSSRLEDVVTHHSLILPQLSANGVDGWRIRKETGWGVHWGPVQASDIPAYLAEGCKKTEAMRRKEFPIKDRMEMATSSLGLSAFLVLVPVVLFWRALFWPAAIALLALTYFYAMAHPWFPGNSGIKHSLSLVLTSLIALIAWTVLIHPLSLLPLFHRAVGLAVLSVFTAAEMPGMSPVMRSGENHYGWEMLIGAALALIYWLLPAMLGWS